MATRVQASGKFPEPIRKSGLLAIPVLIVAAFLLFWLVRVHWKRHRAAVEQPR